MVPAFRENDLVMHYMGVNLPGGEPRFGERYGRVGRRQKAKGPHPLMRGRYWGGRVIPRNAVGTGDSGGSLRLTRQLCQRESPGWLAPIWGSGQVAPGTFG